jgi:hypothetical protein
VPIQTISQEEERSESGNRVGAGSALPVEVPNLLLL